ncbi:MAG: choice-of-anchor O protein [Xanthomonadales bacterium]|nr:choice-of-anchor O protein [Xanthomonadales bacterium]
MNIIKLIAAAICITFATGVMADDGELLRKSISRAPGQPDTVPISEAEHAFVDVMPFYVDSEAASGDPVPIEYINIDGTLVDTREAAKPLVGVYIYGPVEHIDGTGFVGHGRRDAFAAVSTDDGNTWKRTNLSDSADQSSSSVVRTDIELFDDLSGAYPGDVVNIFQATAGNVAVVAWQSRYCRGGMPIFAGDTPSTDRTERLTAIADYMDDFIPGMDYPADGSESPEDIYLLDMFGVAGSQGSVDYALDKFEQNRPVGEVPYNCLWVARGTLEYDVDTDTTDMVWRKAERLTSGRRDVNRVEVKMVKGVGAVITWQEDPDGLRPGQGEGPGEGWSGAIANHKTDVWYSYIDWEFIQLVQTSDEDYTPIPYVDYLGDTRPKVGIPFAMPMRLTNNAKCNITNPQPYCIGSALTSAFPEEELLPLDYGMRDMCIATVEPAQGPQGDTTEVCIAQHWAAPAELTTPGMPLLGNIAATRPRTGLFGYDSDDDGEPDNGWAVVVFEESKGLGDEEFYFDDAGNPCETIDPDTGCDVADYGKDIRYMTFAMSLQDFLGDGGAEDERPLVNNIGVQGHMLNQPETNWETGDLYPVLNTDEMWIFGGDYDYEIYRTEIARRGSLLAQSPTKADASTYRLVALPSWKQGVMRQGGPADVMVRRIVIPGGLDFSTSNPYAFANMVCADDPANADDGWVYDSEVNPYYPGGLCLSPAINLSATVPETCTSDDGTDCPTVDENGVGDTNPILQGKDVEPSTTKVLTWYQCPSVHESCEPDDNNLTDQSWYNPLDVAKGHRGYLDGDFAMILYGWSPNWKLNAKGKDRYELYVRRSFDGAGTWTTLPAGFTASDGQTFSGDGTTTCEAYRQEATGGGSSLDEPHVCYTYGAGEPEMARNVTQLKSMKFTTLDPRYAKTKATIEPELDRYPGEVDTILWSDPEDVRDPSRYFLVYETGDNSTVEEGEAEPLNLYYSRAVMFGDHYQVWTEEDDLTECYPSAAHDDEDVPVEVEGSGFCNEFDKLEGKKTVSASEASIESNPGGEFMYGAWSQMEHDKETGEDIESNAIVRRVWYIDEWISQDAYDLETSERIFNNGFEDGPGLGN